MAAQKETSFVINAPIEKVNQWSLNALNSMGAEIVRDYLYALEGKTNSSWQSYGENITVKLTAISDQATQVLVCSVSAIGTTMIAWGKHTQNLKNFRDALEYKAAKELAHHRSQSSASRLIELQGNIFISYRRTDTADDVGRIYDRLIGVFGREKVFKDVDSVKLGQDFRVRIRQALDSSCVFLPLIGPHWMIDDSGNYKFDNPNDWVRLEVEAALNSRTPIIPIFVRSAQMPLQEQLPDPLKPLVFRNGLAIRPDPDFGNDIQRLVEAIQHSA